MTPSPFELHLVDGTYELFRMYYGAPEASTPQGNHIEQIPGDPEDWTVDVRGARSLATILRERRQEALLYRQLTTLRTDVPLDESLDDLCWRGARRAEMARLAADLDDKGLMQVVHRWDKGT